MRCAMITLLVLGVFELLNYMQSFSAAEVIAYETDDTTALVYVIIIVVSMIPNIVHYVLILQWVCGPDTIETRKKLIKAMNWSIYSMVWVAVALPVGMLALYGSTGFLLSLPSIISMAIAIAITFWWRSSCIEFYREKVKVENNGEFPKQYDDY